VLAARLEFLTMASIKLAGTFLVKQALGELPTIAPHLPGFLQLHQGTFSRRLSARNRAVKRAAPSLASIDFCLCALFALSLCRARMLAQQEVCPFFLPWFQRSTELC